MSSLTKKPGSIPVSRRNFFFLVTEEVFYYTANAFYDVAAVIPVFIDHLTHNLKLAGLAFTIRNIFFILPQLLMGFLTSRLGSRPAFMKYTAILTRMPLFIFLFILLSNAGTLLITVSILAVCGFLGLADGLFNVPWLDFIGDAVDKVKRGKLFAYILFLGGIGGMLSGFITTYVLNLPASVKIKYFIIFSLGGVIFTGSTISYFFMKETNKTGNIEASTFGEYLGKLPGYLTGNRDFRNLMLTLGFNYFSNLALPLYVVFGKRILELPDSGVSVLIFLQICGMIVGGGAWGYLCYKFSDKFSIQTTVLSNMILPILALLSLLIGNHNIGFNLFCIISFGGGATVVAWPGFVNYVISNVGKNEKSVYIGILNTLTLPLAFLSLLGGFIAEKYSYNAVFLIVLLMCGLSYVFSLKLKNNPCTK